MKRILLRLLVLLPIPVVLGALIWTGTRPVSTALVLSQHKKHPLEPTAPTVQLPGTFESGWKLQGKVERYDRKSLFDRINGAAPAYIRAGFVYSLGAEYAKAGLEDPVVVDVYCMGSPARALGIYATERDPSYTFIEVGQEGYLAMSNLNFWRGEFYIKLAGFAEGVAPELKELAQDLAGALPEMSIQELAPLELLPERDQLPHSKGYSHPPLGDVDGLHQVFYASYRVGDTVYRQFVATDQPDARKAKIKAYFAKDGAQIVERDGLLQISNDASTISLVLRSGKLLTGVLDLVQPGLGPEIQARLREIQR